MAHDLRGNLGVVKTATAGLNRDGLADANRSQLQSILKRGVDSLHLLLNDLVDLARFEAGHERRKLSHFDAAQLLRDLCANFSQLAEERSLFLRAEGPDALSVESDAVKVQRIAQNLGAQRLELYRARRRERELGIDRYCRREALGTVRKRYRARLRRWRAACGRGGVEGRNGRLERRRAKRRTDWNAGSGNQTGSDTGERIGFPPASRWGRCWTIHCWHLRAARCYLGARDTTGPRHHLSRKFSAHL